MIVETKYRTTTYMADVFHYKGNEFPFIVNDKWSNNGKNTKDEYKRFIYKSNYDSWDSSLYKELGFDLANENEVQYLED